MARYSKTICDRCGVEHIDGTVDDVYIVRVVISYGHSSDIIGLIHTGRDLCMVCRDTTSEELKAIASKKGGN